MQFWDYILFLKVLYFIREQKKICKHNHELSLLWFTDVDVAIFMFRFVAKHEIIHILDFRGTLNHNSCPDKNRKPFLSEVYCWQKAKRLPQSRLLLSLIRPLIKAIRKQMPEIWIALNVIWTRACLS